MKFADDLYFDDMLYGVLVRSPIQVGSIAKINLPALPDGVHFFDAENVPKHNSIETRGTVIPVFTKESVSYCGQPVGVLVGKDESLLVELCNEIEFEGGDLLFDTNGELLVGFEFSDCFSDEQIIARKTLIQGEVDKVYEDAMYQFEEEFSSSLVFPTDERSCVVAHYTGKILHLYTSSHWESHLKKNVASVLGIKESSIVVHQTLTKEQRINDILIGTVLASQAAVASYYLKKPVKLCYSIDEEQEYIEREVSASIRHRTSVDENGIISSMDVCIRLDAGAFSPFIQYILDRMAITACGVYAPKNLRVDVYALKTSYPPLNCSYYWGDSQAFFAVENHLHTIASALEEKIGIDLLKFKMQNAVLQANKSNFFLRHTSYGNVPFFAEILKKSDFEQKNYFYNLLAKKESNVTLPITKMKRGIGIATAYEGNGFLFPDSVRSKYNLECTIESDGSFCIKCPEPSEMISSFWKNIIKKSLGIEENLIHFAQNSAEKDAKDPDVLRENLTIMTGLLKKCCSALQKKRFREPLPLSVKKSFSLSQKNVWNNETFTGQPFQSSSWALAVIEVEIDTITYDVRIRNCTVGIDGGAILNEQKAKDTVRHLLYQISAHFIEMSSLDIENVVIHFYQSDEQPKEIGEIICNVVPAAFTQAIAEALNEPICTLPLKNDAMYEMIFNKGDLQ